MKFRFRLISEKAGHGPLSKVRVQLIGRAKGVTFAMAEVATNPYGYGIFSIREDVEAEVFLRLTPDFAIQVDDVHLHAHYAAEFAVPEGVEADAVACHTLPWHTDDLSLDDISAVPSAFPDLGDGAFGEGYCGRILPSDRVPEFTQLTEVRRTLEDGFSCKESELHLEGGEALTHEVKHSFLGLSLGHLLKSTTLMPCEKVTIAVREWTNRTRQTQEQSSQSGQTQSQFLNDRQSLNELVQQSASEFSVGLKVGAKATVKKIDVAVGLGAGYSTSQADASIRQDLSRTMRATASAYRNERRVGLAEVNQAYAQEDVVRTFCNNNHCRTLNVFWRQVYENYKSEIRHLGTRKVVFWPQSIEDFTPEKIACKRYLLEGNLLDPRLEACWDGFARHQVAPKPETVEADGPRRGGDSTGLLKKLDMWIAIGGNGFAEGNAFSVTLKMKDGSTQKAFVERDSRWKKNEQYSEVVEFDSSFDPTEIAQIIVSNESTGVQGGAVEVNTIEFSFLEEGKQTLYSGPVRDRKIRKGGSEAFDVSYMRSDETPDAPVAPPVIDDQAEKDAACATRLEHHIQCNAHYYSQLLWLGVDVEERRCMFEKILCEGRPLTDFIDPVPLGLWGCNLVFARADIPFEPVEDAPVTEDLITLPTNGVFADAALGQCGTCEPIEEGVFRDYTAGHCGCSGADTLPAPSSPEGISTGIIATGDALTDLLDNLPAAGTQTSVLAAALQALATQNAALLKALLEGIKLESPKPEEGKTTKTTKPSGPPRQPQPGEPGGK